MSCHQGEKARVRIGIAHFGCRANFGDSELMEDHLLSYPSVDIVPVKNSGPAQDFDAVIINSCTITDTADRECRLLIRRLVERSDVKPLVAVVGCYASRAPKEVLDLPGVDQVFSTKRKQEVVPWVVDVLGLPQETVVSADDRPRRHARAFLKVQDGCQDYCAFCIVPYARGRSRSIPKADILARCNELVMRRVKEVVITGINVGRYGLDVPGQKGSLVDVVTWVSEVDDIKRIRLSSIDPMDVTPELIRALGTTPKGLPSFHLPIQSGSDRILEAMGRRYRKQDVVNRVSWIMEQFPDATIGCDVLVGFPGETESDFQETYELLERLPIAKFHVFPYSVRPGTRAAKMSDHVPSHLKHYRVAELLKLGERQFKSAMTSMVGKRSHVLVENVSRGMFRGYTHNYLPVYGEALVGCQSNSIVEVSLQNIDSKPILTYPVSLFGRIKPELEAGSINWGKEAHISYSAPSVL